MHLFPTAFFMGLVGLDITGAIIVTSALAMKSKKGQVYLLTATALVAEVVLGVLFSRVLGKAAGRWANAFDRISDDVFAALGILVGAALLYWFVRRVFMKGKKGEGNREQGAFERFLDKGLFAAGVILALWAVTDPPFWGVVAAASQNDGLIAVTAAFAVYAIVSQLPLCILTVATAFDKHEPMIRFIQSRPNDDSRLRSVLRTALTVLILVGAIYFLAESLCFFMTGAWLF